MTNTFHNFNSFPPEIRQLIWLETLSVDNGALVLFCEQWCGQFLRKNSRKKGRDLRCFVKVASSSLATLSVCREAREITKKWLGENGYSFRLRDESNRRIIVREWDRTRDTIYVPGEKWDDLLTIALDEGKEEGIDEMGQAIEHIAFSAFTAYYSIENIAWISPWMPNLRTMRVIYNNQPESFAFHEARPEDVPVHEEHNICIKKNHVACQPRYETREITDIHQVVKLCREDEYGDYIGEESGELEMWEEEMHAQWMITEDVPNSYIDTEKGIMKIMESVIAVRVD